MLRYCYVALLLHRAAVTLRFCYIVLMLHCAAVTSPCCSIALMLHHATVTSRYCYVTILLRPSTLTSHYSYVTLLLRCATLTSRYSYVTLFLRRATLTQCTAIVADPCYLFVWGSQTFSPFQACGKSTHLSGLWQVDTPAHGRRQWCMAAMGWGPCMSPPLHRFNFPFLVQNNFLSRAKTRDLILFYSFQRYC
jgi:hypothetical protein